MKEKIEDDKIDEKKNKNEAAKEEICTRNILFFKKG